MTRIRQFLFPFLAWGVILSCARAPHEQITEPSFIPLPSLDEKKSIRLHALHAVPRGTLLGPAIYFGVDEGVDSEKIRISIVRLIYGEGTSRTGGSGFFVAPDKIATNIHVLADADVDSLHVRSTDTDHAIQGVTAFDAQNDLVVLKVSGEGVPLALGDSNGVKRGDPVFSVGYSMDRYNVRRNSVDSVQHNGISFQLTSNILPGSSGGPVLNTEGQVIGVNVAGFGHSGFAIVSDALKILLTRETQETLVQWEKRESVRAYAYLVQATQEFHTGAYAKAIETLNKFIKLNPTFFFIAETYHNRGSAKMFLGRTYFNSGNVAAARRNYRAALEDYDKAISLNAEELTVYTNRGVTKVALGLSKTSQGHGEAGHRYYHAAIGDFGKTISLNPGDAYTYNVRGYVRICLGHLEADRGNTDAAHALYRTAITDSDSAIRLDSENPYHYHTRGVAKAALDDYSGAVADFDQTLSLKSDFARAYSNRAYVKTLLGQHDAAQADFQKARELRLDVEK